ncbi:hypothetical protein FA15DRAFT_711969, partial [Coprinopsis marcescibilis]
TSGLSNLFTAEELFRLHRLAADGDSVDRSLVVKILTLAGGVNESEQSDGTECGLAGGLNERRHHNVQGWLKVLPQSPTPWSDRNSTVVGGTPQPSPQRPAADSNLFRQFSQGFGTGFQMANNDLEPQEAQPGAGGIRKRGGGGDYDDNDNDDERLTRQANKRARGGAAGAGQARGKSGRTSTRGSGGGRGAPGGGGDSRPCPRAAVQARLPLARLSQVHEGWDDGFRVNEDETDALPGAGNQSAAETAENRGRGGGDGDGVDGGRDTVGESVGDGDGDGIGDGDDVGGGHGGDGGMEGVRAAATEGVS